MATGASPQLIERGASPPLGLDAARLELLYAELETSIYNVVYRWLWNAEDAHDVVQEAFVRVWRMRERVRTDTVEPLLYRVAINLASNRRRSRKLWQWVSLSSGAEPESSHRGPHESLEQAERAAAVRRAVDRLPERYRRVVMLCELSDLTYAEVAEALGIPPGTVASRRHQAMKLLQDELGQLEEHDDHLQTRPV